MPSFYVSLLCDEVCVQGSEAISSVAFLKQEITEVIFQKETQKKLIIMVIQYIVLP